MVHTTTRSHHMHIWLRARECFSTLRKGSSAPKMEEALSETSTIQYGVASMKMAVVVVTLSAPSLKMAVVVVTLSAPIAQHFNNNFIGIALLFSLSCIHCV
jgi:hypothetical protein